MNRKIVWGDDHIANGDVFLSLSVIPSDDTSNPCD
jgi:hypothetical protein